MKISAIFQRTLGSPSGSRTRRRPEHRFHPSALEAMEDRVVPSGVGGGRIPPLSPADLVSPPGQGNAVFSYPRCTDIEYPGGHRIGDNAVPTDFDGVHGWVLKSSVVTVTVKNISSTDQYVTFAAYKVPNDNFASQTLKLSTTVLLKPGESADLTLDLSDIPGASGVPKGVYQLDIFCAEEAPKKVINPSGDYPPIVDGQLVVLVPDRVVPPRGN